jgi:hypothetical protein
VGIDFPAVVIGELELNGYAIERVYEHGRMIGVRLLETEAPDPPTSRRRQRLAPTFAIATDATKRDLRSAMASIPAASGVDQPSQECGQGKGKSGSSPSG